MDNSTLVRILGFPATLIHGDSTVLDRWRWLRRRLPRTANGEALIDVGCGTGAFTIGAARRGYGALGLSFDQRNRTLAAERAGICNAPTARFEVLDVRKLGSRQDLIAQYDVALCLENIEHILDDRKLMCDMARCLRPGGRLLLTTPNFYRRPVARADRGPFPKVDGGPHVRRGYTRTGLVELCGEAGLACENISFCSGFLSQHITRLQFALSKIHPLFGWAVSLPLRILPPLLDRPLTSLIGWPWLSICLEAYKPRFGDRATSDE